MMDTGSLVLFFGIAGAVVGIGLYFAASSVREMNRALREAAARLGGTFREGGLFDDPEVDFTLAHSRAYLRICRRDRGALPYMRAAVDIRNRTKGRFSIEPVSLPVAFLRHFGPPYVTIGDREFDREYAVQSEPRSIAERVFAPSRRAQAIASVRRLLPEGRPSIVLDEEYLVVQVTRYDPDPELLMALVKTAEEILGYLLESAPLPGIRVENVSSLSGGECPVCGSRMEEDVVNCEACRTPHHRECWHYMGRCTTYACRGRRFVA